MAATIQLLLWTVTFSLELVCGQLTRRLEANCIISATSTEQAMTDYTLWTHNITTLEIDVDLTCTDCDLLQNTTAPIQTPPVLVRTNPNALRNNRQPSRTKANSTERTLAKSSLTTNALSRGQQSAITQRLITIQFGHAIRFQGSSSYSGEASVPVDMFMVTEVEYTDCTMANGQALGSLRANKQTVFITQLPPGTVYIIGKCDQCCMRYNITVKPQNCQYLSTVENGVLCNRNGKCFTNSSKSDYTCQCCDGYTGEYCEEKNGCYGNPCGDNETCKDVQEGSEGDKYSCFCENGLNCELFPDYVNEHFDDYYFFNFNMNYVHNAYFAAAILLCAVLMVLAFVLACHCHVYKTYRKLSRFTHCFRRARTYRIADDCPPIHRRREMRREDSRDYLLARQINSETSCTTTADTGLKNNLLMHFENENGENSAIFIE